MKFKYKLHGQVLLTALLLLFVGSCKKDDFLNVPPKGLLTNVITFSSEANADLFINDIYDNLPNLNDEDVILDQYSDNSCVGATWMPGQAIVRSNSLGPSNTMNGPGSNGGIFNWSNDYTVIRKCNVFLQQAALNQNNFSAAWYTERVGEVHFLRAFFYSLLYENFGGVPLVARPLDVATQGDSIFLPRSSMDSTLAFIVADCDAAAAVLPQQPQNTGRATQGAAMTLKAEVQLFAASPLANTSGDLSKWATAAASNLAVMNLGVYSLFANYSTMFLASNNWNPEQIFARGYAVPGNGHRHEGLVGPVIVFGVEEAWGNMQPTQNLVDDYEMNNGLPITDPASGYDPQHPYVGREQRFYQSVVYDSSLWQGYLWTSRLGGNNAIDLGSTSDISNTGYNGKKTLDSSILGQTSLGVSPGTSNYTYYRYAEVLLSYAEAQNESVGADATVYAAINAVRARSALSPLPAGLSQSDMRTDIWRERRIEFAFEDKRWYDIRRWDITTKGPAVLTTPQYGMEIVGTPGAPTTYTKVQVFANKFTEYMNWLPIPESVIEQNPQLTQNPGY
jgi:hypothetical protein